MSNVDPRTDLPLLLDSKQFTRAVEHAYDPDGAMASTADLEQQVLKFIEQRQQEMEYEQAQREHWRATLTALQLAWCVVATYKSGTGTAVATIDHNNKSKRMDSETSTIREVIERQMSRSSTTAAPTAPTALLGHMCRQLVQILYPSSSTTTTTTTTNRVNIDCAYDVERGLLLHVNVHALERTLRDVIKRVVVLFSLTYYKLQPPTKTAKAADWFDIAMAETNRRVSDRSGTQGM